MLVYEIKRELAPVFSGIVPEHVLRMVGKPGYHSLGEIFTTGDEDYPSAFLQYYDGSVKKAHEAKLIYLYVEEADRNEASAWSLLKEMENRLHRTGIKNLSVYLNGDHDAYLRPYLKKRGFTDRKDATYTLATTTGALIPEKLLSLPDNPDVHLLKTVPKSEIQRILSGFGKKTLEQLHIDADINADSYSFDLSVMYHSELSDGLFLVAKMPEGGLMPRMLRCTGKDTSNPMLYMMSKTAKVLKSYGALSVPVFIPCYDEKTIELVKSLNPGISLTPVWQGECNYE